MTNPVHGIIGREQLDGSGSPYGGAGNAPDPNPFPKGTRLRMFNGSVADPSDCAEAEELLTKSLVGGGVLKKKGDVIVLDREGSFDRRGEYHVYLYYAELAEDPDDGNKKDSNEA